VDLEGSLGLGEDEGEGSGINSGLVFFRIARIKPSARKVVQVAASAGNRLRQHHLAITIHREQATTQTGVHCVSSEPNQHGGGSLLLLDNIGNPLELEASMQQWTGGSLQYTFVGVPDLGFCDPVDIADTVCQQRKIPLMLVRCRKSLSESHSGKHFPYKCVSML
jgi:hypothetical protein